MKNLYKMIFIALMTMISVKTFAQQPEYSFKRDYYDQDKINLLDSRGITVGYYKTDYIDKDKVNIYNANGIIVGYYKPDYMDNSKVNVYSTGNNYVGSTKNTSSLEIPQLTGLFDPVPYNPPPNAMDNNIKTIQAIQDAKYKQMAIDVEKEVHEKYQKQWEENEREHDRIIAEREANKKAINHTAKEYSKQDPESAEFKYYMSEISNRSKDIEHTPNNPLAYYERGIAKSMLEDYRGAVVDFTKAMNIDPKYMAICYFERGVAKYSLKDDIGAIADFTKFIEINPEDNRHILPYAYVNRGLAKINLGQKDSGCLDLSKAGELGLAEVYEDIKKYCNK